MVLEQRVNKKNDDNDNNKYLRTVNSYSRNMTG